MIIGQVQYFCWSLVRLYKPWQMKYSAFFAVEDKKEL